MEASVPQTPVDHFLSKTDCAQLPPRHHPVLGFRNPGNAAVTVASPP
jgi:hypothetical protein